MSVGQWALSRRRDIIVICADIASAGTGRPRGQSIVLTSGSDHYPLRKSRLWMGGARDGLGKNSNAGRPGAQVQPRILWTNVAPVGDAYRNCFGAPDKQFRKSDVRSGTGKSGKDQRYKSQDCSTMSEWHSAEALTSRREGNLDGS